MAPLLLHCFGNLLANVAELLVSDVSKYLMALGAVAITEYSTSPGHKIESAAANFKFQRFFLPFLVYFIELRFCFLASVYGAQFWLYVLCQGNSTYKC